MAAEGMDLAQTVDDRRAQFLFENTILLDLTTRRAGVRRKVAAVDLGLGPDEEILSITKKLLGDCSDVQRAGKTLSDAVRGVKALSAPSPFRGGIHLVRTSAVTTVDKILRDARDSLEVLVERLVEALPVAIAKDRERLGRLFREDEYPSGDDLREAYALNWYWLAFTVPDKLSGIDPELLDRERRKMEATLTTAVAEVSGRLREQFASLVDHLVDRLSPAEDGSKKVLTKSTVDNIAAFIKAFDVRDVSDDKELRAVIGRAEALLSGIDIKDLRKDEVDRDSLREAFAKLREEIQTRNRQTRAIDLSEQDELPLPFQGPPA